MQIINNAVNILPVESNEREELLELRDLLWELIMDVRDIEDKAAGDETPGRIWVAGNVDATLIR